MAGGPLAPLIPGRVRTWKAPSIGAFFVCAPGIGIDLEMEIGPAANAAVPGLQTLEHEVLIDHDARDALSKISDN